MRREAVCRSDVDSFKIRTPTLGTADAITDFVEDLLVPADRAKQLRRKFIFGFNVIREGISVSHIRDFKTRFIEFGPKLQVMPCEADVLSENEFSVVADVPTGRQ